ncbi:helix-turn-helix domain-containing protein [Paenibacillus sambharensis]|uniref:helix-turn-helix domain-containing protein n=1 Tax=Paenibacillus sambharensis TaxID=1803190 RepID=UPI0015E8B717|nr:helix-turn-helix domain-containing protein [Paenibacillus sambharensis]
MRFNRIRRNGKLYVNLLLGITLCIVLSVLASSSIYYMTFTQILQHEAYESALANLRQTGRTVAKTTESAQAVAFQIYRNSAIAKLLYYNDPHPFDTQAAMIDLNNYLTTMPFIHSIYVYNPASQRYYIAGQSGQKGIIQENELKDQSIADILGSYDQYKPFTPIPRIIPSPVQQEADISVYTYLCYEAIGFNREINSAVIVNIAASWINQELISQQDENSVTLFVDDRQTVLSADDLSQVTLHTADLRMIQQLTASKESGYRIADFGHKKSLITYTAPDPYDWHYVRIISYSDITKKMGSLRLKTLTTVGVVLTVGLLLAWLVSRFLYAPINKIEKQMKDLETEKRNSSYTVRQNTMRKLIQIQGFDPAVQAAKLKRLGIAFDLTLPYRLAYLLIESPMKQDVNKDLQTYKFAVMNIATEICSRQYSVDSVDLDEGGILMLINTGEEAQAPAEWHQSMLQDIQKACMEYLRVELTITITPVTLDPHELHRMYKLAREASSQRFFRGRGAIMEAVPLIADHKYLFPLGKEKRLIEALTTGKTDDAKVLLQDIMQETAAYSYPAARAAAAHLSVTLEHMLTEIERNGSPQLGLGTDLIIPRIEQFDTLAEMITAFHGLFDRLKVKLADRRNGKQGELVRKINDIIMTRYSDPNLSLNSIADELKLSTCHVSRVYRQQAFTSIVDRINYVRIGKAKELLTDSELPITDIAERTGYSNSSYFHRIFKKINGVTPAEFRKAGR